MNCLLAMNLASPPSIWTLLPPSGTAMVTVALSTSSTRRVRPSTNDGASFSETSVCHSDRDRQRDARTGRQHHRHWSWSTEKHPSLQSWEGDGALRRTRPPLRGGRRQRSGCQGRSTCTPGTCIAAGNLSRSATGYSTARGKGARSGRLELVACGSDVVAAPLEAIVVHLFGTSTSR